MNTNPIIYDVPVEKIPNIDLYVDQVVELYNGVTLIGEDKSITKAMINNYSKAKLLKNIKGRKYTYAHTIIIGIINRLKQSLTILEIKALLVQAEADITEENGEYITEILENLYSQYISLSKKCGCDVNMLIDILSQEKKNKPNGIYIILKALCLCKISQELRIKAI